MAYIAMKHLTNMQRYWLITGSVGPRPIALVTSVNEEGLCNAAPYSSFNYMGEDPPLLVMGIDHYGEESHRPGEKKDTLKNIIARGEFVVNMVDEAIIEKAVLCGTDFPAHVSEAEAIGFTLAASTSIAVPRIAESPISWECKLFKIVDFSQQRSIVFGEIVAMVFRDDLLDTERLRVNVEAFKPVGRLGGPNYCTTGERMRFPVPPFRSDSKPRN